MPGIAIPEYGVFVLDPGLSTGLCWARLRDEGTVAERLAARTHAGSETLKDNDWFGQARAISQRWQTFRRECEAAGLPAYMVAEDFILTRFKSSDRTGLYPVWIAAALRGYRSGLADGYESAGFGPARPVETIWQSPSSAKTFATDERLKMWGLWIRGREHERDAWRHLAYFVASKPGQSLRASRERIHPPPREASF